MTTVTRTRRTARSVGAVLATIHEEWMRQVAVFLGPALNDDVDFWTRWTAARFLSDRFGDRFRLECALVDALGDLVSDEAAGNLAAAQAGLERIAEQLSDAGRRRATRMLTARLARRFIDQLALWCVEVEVATNHLDTAELPEAAGRLLPRLRAADDLALCAL
jgi:hypothetical protein